jgi:hypothetical protein
MTIDVRPKDADALAAALRDETASADDLLRIERGLARELRARTASRPSRSRVPAGLAIAALAAVVLLWFGRPVTSPTPAPVASIDAARAGQVIEGPMPRETQLGNAHLAVGAASSLRVDEIDITRAAVTLARGTVHVAFHPEHRGEEHLAVLTAAARVDVVGTEFVVTIAEDGGTRVEVIEGIVRVTPTSGDDATLVRAGESIDVAVAVAAADVEAAAVPEALEQATEEPHRVQAAPRVTETLEEQLTRLEGEASDHARERDFAAVVETTTRILALRPHGDRGANALYERAQAREHLADTSRARADYERYLAEHPAGPFAAQAQQAIDRLSALPSTP